jgi:hypothetical protein
MLSEAQFESLIARKRDEVGMELRAQDVRDEFGPMFTREGIATLDPEQFREFLTYRGNRHWKNINRHSGQLVADLPLLKETLLVLIDENRPIAERINEAHEMLPGLGKAAISAILQVKFPTKYGVFNDVSDKGLRLVGMHPVAENAKFDGLTLGEQYELVNAVLTKLSAKYDISLWALDTVWGAPWNPR